MLDGAANLMVWSAAVEWLIDGPTAALVGAARAMADGTWWVPSSDARVPMGDVLAKMAELRKQVGVLKAKTKQGVRFKVRSADELADKVRPVADELGLLIYPVAVTAKGHVVEGGTLAEATVTLRIQAISDESFIDVVGFGLGADNQDKAGGKAGTYAWKTALVQALIAGGEKDTDDTDTPIKGGVAPKRQTVPAPQSLSTIALLIEGAKAAKSLDQLRAAMTQAGGLSDEDQAAVAPMIKAAAAEIRGAA